MTDNREEVSVQKHPNAPAGRATGQTFRALCQALATASDGERVIFVTRDVDWASDKALRILAGFGIPFKGRNRRIINFPGGGSLRFSRTDDFYGQPQGTIFTYDYSLGGE